MFKDIQIVQQTSDTSHIFFEIVQRTLIIYIYIQFNDIFDIFTDT